MGRDDAWQRAVDDLKREGWCGPSASASTAGSRPTCSRRWNRPHRQRAGGLQRLRPGARRRAVPLCRQHGIAVIARVPFDEGSLTGTLTRDSSGRRATGATSTSPRRTSSATLARVERLQPLVPAGMDLPSWRCASSSSTRPSARSIPGMRRPATSRGTWPRATGSRSRPDSTTRSGRTAGTDMCPWPQHSELGDSMAAPSGPPRG